MITAKLSLSINFAERTGNANNSIIYYYMNKSKTILAALLAAMSLLSACKKDSKTDESWKEIPTTLFTAETGTASFDVNSIPVSIGSVKLVASSNTKAVLVLNNVIPCTSSVSIDVDLKKSSDTQWTFSGTGSIDKLSVLSVKGVDQTAIYTVAVDGTVDNGEKVTVNATTSVNAKGDMEGSWNLLRESSIGAGGLPAIMPLQISWTASGEYALKAATMATAFSVLGSVELADELDQITFHEDGNITAKYWQDDSDSDEQVQIPDIQTLLKSLIGPDMKYHFPATSHTDWLELPKANLAFWYSAGGYLFEVPNLSALTDAGMSDFSITEIYKAVQELKGIGVDTKQLITVIDALLDKGIVFKCTASDSAMALSIDKSLCGTLVNAFLPVLKQLDVLIENMDSNPDLDDETKAELKMLQTILAGFGLEKPSDLIPIWENTTEFVITMNFTR